MDTGVGIEWADKSDQQRANWSRQQNDYLATQRVQGEGAYGVGHGGRFGGALGLGGTPQTPDERLEEQGRMMERMIDIGYRTPEDYGISQEQYDQIVEDRVQQTFLRRQEENLEYERGVKAGIIEPSEAADMADNEPRSRLSIAWDAFKSKLWGSDEGVSRMMQDNAAVTASRDYDAATYRALGTEYIANISDTYEDLGDDARDFLGAQADKYGVPLDTYFTMVANNIDDMAEYAVAEIDESIRRNTEAFEDLPEIENFGDNPLGYVGNLLTRNTDSATIMAIGMLTRSPTVMATLFGTDVYANSYVEARADGKSKGEANMDAMTRSVIELATEGIPLGRILNRAGKPMSRRRKVFEAMRDEALQEGLVSVLNMGYDYGMYDETVTLGEAFVEVRDSMLVGGLFGGGMAAPFSVTGDFEMANLQGPLGEAAAELQSVAQRMQDPNQRVTRQEFNDAKAKYVKAKKAVTELQNRRAEEKAQKKEAKQEKRTAKKRKKMTSQQRQRDIAREEQVKKDQTLKGTPTEADIEQADLIERIGKREVTEDDAAGVEALLDAGYAQISPRGDVVLNQAAKRRLAAIRAAQKAAVAPTAVEGEVIEPTPYERPAKREARRKREALERGEVEIKPQKFKSQQKRRAEIMSRVDKKLDEKAAGKIADAIIKEEQESVAFAELEARQAKEAEKKRDKDYDAALKQLAKEEVDVAQGLIAMDEKSVSGYQGTRLGDVLRGAMATLEKQEAKAKEALKDAFWNKPVQGQLFDVGGALAKGTKDYANLVKVGALALAKTGLKYSAWSADMVGQFGESIKPALASVYADAKKNIKNVMRISHEKFKSGKRKGQLKYSPTQFAKPGEIRRLRAQLEKLAKEGKQGRLWYERTGAKIMEITGADPADAKALAGLLAIYSSGTAVGANLTNALKMWADWKAGDLKLPKKGTKAGRFSEQDRTALEWLQSDHTDENFVEKFGSKRFPFFTNIMRAIDPATYELGQGATVDLWMMRAFGYHTEAPTDPQNAFAATEIRKIAEKMGWEKQQAQAAIWVAIKARWEYIQKVAKQRAVDEGKAVWVKGAKGAPVFEVSGSTREQQLEFEKDIISIFREEAFRVSVKELTKKLNESAQDFADYMERHYATMSWEAEPSTKLGLDFGKLPLAAKIEMQAEIAALLTNPKTGREFLAEWLGLLGNQQFVGPGAWELSVGAAVQNTLVVPPQHKAKGAEASKNAAESMNAMAAIYGFLLQQDAVAWHRPFYGRTLKGSNGLEIVGPTLTYGQTKRLYVEILRAAAAQNVAPETAMEFAPIVLDGATRVLNFTSIPNRQFHKIIEAAANEAGLSGTIEVFESDGGYIFNDWIENPNGEGYVDQINQAQNPEVQKAFARAQRKFAKRIKDIRKKYAEKYDAFPSKPAHVVKAGKEKKLGKGMIRFRHFSKVEPKSLRVDKFGTGIKGAEQSRGSGLIPVISAYPDKGFRKEVGLGPNEYVIDVRKEDLYDINADPLGFKEGSKEPQSYNRDMKPVSWRTDMNRLEALIKEAGFVGYYVPKAEGNLKGQARFFVDLPIEGAEVAAEITAKFSVAAADTVEIRENEYDEFEVPEQNGEIYYASEMDDAINTARTIWGDSVEIELYDSEGELRDTLPANKRPKNRITLRQTSAEAREGVNEFMDEYDENTWANPITPDERIHNDAAGLTIRPSGDHIWLDSIRAFTKGAGAGSAALDMVLDLADRHGVVLKGFAEPFGEGGLNRADLVAWYKDRGFVFDGNVMVRAPQGPRDISKTFMFKKPSKPTNEGMGIPQKEAEKLTHSFAEMLGLPREMFHVVDSVEQLPDEAYSQILYHGLSGTVQGLYHEDPIDGPQIWVVSNNMWHQSATTNGKKDGPLNTKFGMPSVRMLQELLVHETLGHYGLRAFLGAKKYQQFMKQIRRAFPEEVKRRGKGMRDTQSGWDLAAEETFAYRIQRELQGMDLRRAKVSIVDKIISEFKMILARMGMRKLTDQDMLDMMFRVAQFARTHTEATLSKRAMRVEAMRVAMQQMERAEMRVRQAVGEEILIMSKLKSHKGKLVFKHDDKGGMEVFDENGKAMGYVLPTVSEEVLRASPGIQSWSVSGSKTNPTIKSKFSILKEERANDPDLDRFMNKIGHHKSSKLMEFRDWWFRVRENWREAVEREIFDAYAGIRRREKELGIFGEESGYMSVRLAAGVDVMVRSAIEHGVPIWKDGWVAIDESQKSLIDVMAPVAQNAEMLKMFEAFIVARRARTLKKQDREKLMEREEIAAVFNYVRKHKLYGLFRDTARDMADYKKQVLDFAQEAGIINKETRPLWERADHVPFYRVLAKGDKVGPFAASRMGHIKNPIRRLIGGTAPLKEPLDSIMQNMSMLIEAAVKNKAMTDVVNNFNGTGVITKAPQAQLSNALIPLEQIQDMLDEAGVSIDAVGRDMLQGIQKLNSLQAPTDENVVSVLENGKKQYYYVHDPSIMRGLESVTPKQWGALMRILRAPKRWLTWSITRMPDFILKNWFRDMWHAYVLSRKGTVVPVYDSVKGWAKAIRQDETFRDMMAGGGVFQAGYVNAADPKGTKTAIRAQVLGQGRHGVLDTPRKLWRFYTRIADGAENAHRVAVYQKTMKATGSRKQALFESRDLMDFSVRGAHGIIRFLVETVPFWGARMQGIQRTYKGFRENPATTFARAVPIVLASIAYYAFIRDDERYARLNEYDKRMYYHFFDVFEQGDHWRLPKPFEIGAIFSSIPEIITEYTLSEQPDKGKAMARSLYFTVAEMLSLAPNVQTVMPFWELYTNENSFTGAPIVPYHMRDGNMPEGQYDSRTNVTIKWLAQSMPDSAPEFMRSPKQLEHLMRGYFASLMDYTLLATDEIYYQTNPDEARPPERRWDQTPFVKSFRREEYGRYDMYQDAMYEVLEEANKVHRRINQLIDEGERGAARELRQSERQLLIARGRMQPAQRQITRVNQQILRIEQSETLSPSEKRERIDRLYERRAAYAERVYDYRPGGALNQYEEGEERNRSYTEAVSDFLEGLIGQTREEQVDELLANNLPHTATLINDMSISPDKLRDVV